MISVNQQNSAAKLVKNGNLYSELTDGKTVPENCPAAYGKKLRSMAEQKQYGL